MLLKLREEISKCYRRAEEAREKADATNDPAEKAEWKAVGSRWMFLARSYEFSEWLTRFSKSRDRIGLKERGPSERQTLSLPHGRDLNPS
jgi:hypothetical protein